MSVSSVSLIRHFSPSSLSCYLECPRLFFYKYVAKINILIDSVHLVFGTAVHKAIETRNGNIDEARKVFLKEFDSKKISLNDMDKYQELIPIGDMIVKTFLEKRDYLNKVYMINSEGQKELFVESVLENPITGEKLKIPMKGRIDELTKIGQIIDYKTSKDFYNPDDEKFKFQTKLYALWYWTEYKKLPPNIIYFVLPKNMKRLQSENPIQVIDLQFSIEELAEAWMQTKSVLSEINQKIFNAGRCLPYCDHRKLDELLIPKVGEIKNTNAK